MLQSKPKRIVLAMLMLVTWATLVQSVSANDYRTDQEVNQMCIDRYEIEEPQEEYLEIKVECTFYTSLAGCNGDSSCLTASGEKLNDMTIAIPRKVGSTKPIYPFGTKIYIEGIGERIVQDTGNPNYLKIKDDGTIIIDVFVPRNSGESDCEYKQRVLDKGRFSTTAKVYAV